MSVLCAKCGEELIGNVNRCWRCGNQLLSTPDSGEIPPIRRGPVSMATDDSVPVAFAVPLDESETPVAENIPRADEVRTGSPFRADSAIVDPAGQATPLNPGYPQNVLRENFAVAAMVVGFMSFFASLVTEWALIPAAIALALALLGRKSERRRLALAGILIALLAISLATWKTILAVSTYIDRQNQVLMDSVLEEY